MKEFKGTPGPWMVYDNKVFLDIVPERSSGTIGNVCASMHSFDSGLHNGSISTANANLIAAAPELLGALIDIVDHMTTYLPQSSDEYQRALFAIKKALGE